MRHPHTSPPTPPSPFALSLSKGPIVLNLSKGLGLSMDPFALSLSKGPAELVEAAACSIRHFDKLSANGFNANGFGAHSRRVPRPCR